MNDEDLLLISSSGTPIDLSELGAVPYTEPTELERAIMVPAEQVVTKPKSWREQANAALSEALTDMMQHPTETVYDWGLMNFIPGAKGFTIPLGLSFAGANDMLRSGDENVAKLFNQYINNPKDIYHTIRGGALSVRDKLRELFNIKEQ